MQLGCDVVELRIDHLNENAKSKMLEIVASSPIALIATVRSERDGGAFPSAKEAQRLRLIAEVVESSPAFVDLELDIAPPTRSRLARKARNKHVGVILSHHDFGSTPSSNEMFRIVKSMLRAKPDLAKLAFTPKNPDDVSKILDLAHRLFPSEICYTVFGMGRLGTVTRLGSLLLGGSLIYSSLGRTNPKLGQLDVNNVISYLHNVEYLGWRKVRAMRSRILQALKVNAVGYVNSDLDFLSYI